MLYYNLLTSSKLDNYLADVEERAKNLFEQTVKSLAEQEQVTEKLNAENMMFWVQKMNNIRNRATEIVNEQVIYRWEKGTTYGEKYPAHTYIVGSNRHHADDETGWKWTNSNRNELKKVPGSRVRYNATVSVTKTWLAKYSKIFT